MARHFDDDFKRSEALGKEALSPGLKKLPIRKELLSCTLHFGMLIFAQSKYDEARYYGQKKYEWCKQLKRSNRELYMLSYLSVLPTLNKGILRIHFITYKMLTK